MNTVNHDFISNYKVLFAEQVLEAYDPDKTFTGKELLSFTPAKQINLLIIKILFQKWQEEMKSLESPFFDYKHPEVKKALAAFMNTLSQHIAVRSEELKILTAQATEEAILLAAAPADFIELTFGENKHLRLNQKAVKTFLKYIQLNKDEIRDFLQEMDGESVEEVIDAAYDHFDDLELGEALDKLVGDCCKVLDISVDQIYLNNVEPQEEEDEEDPFDFGSSLQENDEEEVSSPPNKEEITEPHQEQDASPPADLQQETPHEHEEKEEVRPAFSTDHTDAKLTSKDTVEKENIFGQEAEEEDLEPKDPKPLKSSEKRFFEDDEDEEDERPTLNKKYEEGTSKSLADVHEEQKIGSIMDSISINHKYMFLQELFGGDNDNFTTAIQDVENMDSFDEAVSYLVSQYSKKYEWNMNSDEVKELLKVIFRRFR
jgi:hypothetical protein